MAKEELVELVEKMKKQEISPTEFFKGLVRIIDKLDVKDEDLQGIIPLLLNFLNRLIQNMEKRGA